MKPITIHVSSSVHQQYQAYAKKMGRKVAELIREAMEQFLLSRIEGKTSLKNLRPLHIQPKKNAKLFNEDLFDDMLDT